MRKNSQSLITRSFLAIFIASIFLLASCDWNASESDATEDSQNVTETSDDDAAKQGATGVAASQKETKGESSDIGTMEDKTIDNVADDEEIFIIVEQMPEYPGGEAALKEYIKDNIRYPAQAKEEFIEGKVFVSFVILPNGKVDDVKVIEGIGGGCDEEAVRVISEMPNWSPGYKEGVAVKVEHTVPINFALH